MRLQPQHLDLSRPAILRMAQAPVAQPIRLPFEIQVCIDQHQPGNHRPSFPHAWHREGDERFAHQGKGALVRPRGVFDAHIAQVRGRFEGPCEIEAQMADADLTLGGSAQIPLERMAHPVPVEQGDHNGHCDQDDERDA